MATETTATPEQLHANLSELLPALPILVGLHAIKHFSGLVAVEGQSPKFATKKALAATLDDLIEMAAQAFVGAGLAESIEIQGRLDYTVRPMRPEPPARAEWFDARRYAPAIG